MRQFKLIIAVFFTLAVFILCLCYFSGVYFGPETTIKYIEIKLSECELLEQAGYNSLANGEINNAKKQLQTAMGMCPDNINIIFQLGVAYCIENNKKACFYYMDLSINKAKNLKKFELEKAYSNEQKSWGASLSGKRQTRSDPDR